MAEFKTDDRSQNDSATIGVFRSSATVKGGKRFSFGAMVVVGDRRGQVGLGYSKGKEVPQAVEKATKDGKKNFKRVPLQGGTIPHTVVGRYSASIVKLVPASPGTGVVAGATVRAILEQVGVTDCLTKAYGSTNKKNLAKAAIAALAQLRQPANVGTLRGVQLGETEVDARQARGKAFMPATRESTGPKGPVNNMGKETRGGRGGGRGGDRGGRGGGGGGDRGRGPAPSEAPASAPEAGSAPAVS
ncbi:MAG: 30S ribosomal protein S5 [Phycisphaerales bacterium]